jgi:hypothetical protein
MKDIKTNLFSAFDEIAEIKALIKFQSLSNETILRETADNGYSLTDDEISGFSVLNTMINNRIDTFENRLSEIYHSIKQ